jgi:hypothetical protein
VNLRNFFAELKRRNVYKVAIAYAVVAWLLMQVASQIFPFFEIPNWAVRLVVLLLIIGFPVAMILAWAFELTPEGIKRAEDVDLSKSVRRKTGRKLDFLLSLSCCSSLGFSFSNAFIPMFRRQFLQLWRKASQSSPSKISVKTKRTRISPKAFRMKFSRDCPASAISRSFRAHRRQNIKANLKI